MLSYLFAGLLGGYRCYVNLFVECRRCPRCFITSTLYADSPGGPAPPGVSLPATCGIRQRDDVKQMQRHKPEWQTVKPRFIDALQLFGLGASWGGYESLVIVADLKDSESALDRALNPVLRLHVGLEDVAELIEDLQHGFAAAGGRARAL